MSNYYPTVFTAPAPPDQILQAFLTALDGSGAAVTLSGPGPNTIVVTRKYTPTWATIVGILGIFLFLIGIFAFLIKETEVLTITLTPEADGQRTKVVISGVAAEPIAARVNQVVGHYRRAAK